MCFVDKVEPASPSSDFYEWVNNKWLNDDTPIPGDYPRWGAFTKLDKESVENQITLLNELCEKTEPSEDELKITAVWKASMDRFAAWEEGDGGSVEALRADLIALDEDLGDLEDDKAFTQALARQFAHHQEQSVAYPIEFSVGPNLDDSKDVVLNMSPAGLSLPTRGHYLDDAFAQQRGWFRAHLDAVADLVGADLLGDEFAERVVRFETKLAMISLAPDQARSYDEYYSVTTLEALASKPDTLRSLERKAANYTANKVDAQDPDLDLLTATSVSVAPGSPQQAQLSALLDALFSALQLRETMTANCKKHYGTTEKSRAERVMVLDGDYFRRVTQLLLAPHNRDDVKAYMMYQRVHAMSEMCTKDLDEVFFDFYGRQLGGQQLQKSSEKRSVGLVNKWVGMLLGKVYVKQHFSEGDKQRILDMIRTVMKVLVRAIKANDWMTKSTKRAALKKLSTFRPKIGYPDRWRDFSALRFDGDEDLAQLGAKVKAFEHRDEFLDKINTPKDLDRWEITPQTVNAYFQPTSNEIVFPAAILQPPFYHKSLDEVDLDLGSVPRDTPGLLDALNFGGIGAVIGHEIIHGVDDQGSKFDHDGNLVDWWADEDRAAFDEKCKLMARQAERYTFTAPSEDGSGVVHRMNASLTMGENLADAGGLAVACKAMLEELHPQPAAAGGSKQSRPAKKVGGRMMSLFRRRPAPSAAGSAAQEPPVDDAADAKLRRDHLELLFRGWATVWRSKQTTAFVVQRLALDPHAPTEFRGNTAANLDEFYEAFEVPEGSRMFIPKHERVQMW